MKAREEKVNKNPNRIHDEERENGEDNEGTWHSPNRTNEKERKWMYWGKMLRILQHHSLLWLFFSLHFISWLRCSSLWRIFRCTRSICYRSVLVRERNERLETRWFFDLMRAGVSEWAPVNAHMSARMSVENIPMYRCTFPYGFFICWRCCCCCCCRMFHHRFSLSISIPHLSHLFVFLLLYCVFIVIKSNECY